MEESVMREQVISAYPGSDVWKQRVKKMKLGQLYAVWIRLRRENKI